MPGDRLTSRLALMLVLASLAACGTTTTQAPAPDHSAEIAALNAYFAADFSCTRAASEDVGLKLLNVQPDRYMDKCIRLPAFTDSVALYVNAAGMKPIKDSTAGLVWKSDDTAKHLKLGPSFVTITGRLRDCTVHNAKAGRAAALNLSVPVAAACKTSATAIFISDVQVTPTAMD